MLSRKENGKYILWDEESRERIEVDKKKADKVLSELEKDLSHIQTLLEDIYWSSPSFYNYLNDYILMDMAEKLMDTEMKDSIKNLKEFSKNLSQRQDEIPAPEDYMTLEDIGFQKCHRTIASHMYEKIIQNNAQYEIVEEIFLFHEKILYRKRITEWEEEIQGCRISKNIMYVPLHLDNYLEKIIENTIEQERKNEEKRNEMF